MSLIPHSFMFFCGEIIGLGLVISVIGGLIMVIVQFVLLMGTPFNVILNLIKDLKSDD